MSQPAESQLPMTGPEPRLPKWLRDIDAVLSLRSQFVLTGNIRDHVLMAYRTPPASGLVDALWTILEPREFQGILVWDPIDGFSSFPEGVRLVLSNRDPFKENRPTRPEFLTEILRDVVTPPQGQLPVAMVVDYASRIDSLLREPAPAGVFVAAEKAAAIARRVPRQNAAACFNPVFWLANRANDLPFWFTADNQRIASVPVPLPGADDRKSWAQSCYHYIHEEDRDWDQDAFADALASMTHGMTLVEVENVARLAGTSRLKASEADNAVERFRVGDVQVDENPWRTSALRDRVAAGEREIERFVKGQQRAKTHVLDILKRTSIGLTGAQTSSAARGPRGVLFFAGPTGVGKTEMAKTIARIVFGDPEACLRFDMSEFKGEHSGDRLIGAPPGYVGFDQGGELTNAVRENPFRVLLFDEIEKAHPRILDKFLQVLSDGRLTDGRGETVYFSESLIVFTSNVGIVGEVRKSDGRVVVEPLVTPKDQTDNPTEFERRVLEGVANHFRRELQRPELHNRLGENIVVFNYIVRDVAIEILDAMLANVKNTCREDTSLTLELTSQAFKDLKEHCTTDEVLANGGRGIGSAIEAVLVNPLARYIFDNDVHEGTLTIQGFTYDERSSAYQIHV